MTTIKEEEFLGSLKALCIRYGVTIEKTVKGFAEELETTYIFDDSTSHANDIYLDMEYVAEFIKG